MIAHYSTAFIFAIITTDGPVPVFWVDTHEQCVLLMDHSLADCTCQEITE